MEEYAKTYAQMKDEELLSLAAEGDSLTESARVALFAELGKRGFHEDAIREYPHALVDAAVARQSGFGQILEKLKTKIGVPGLWQRVVFSLLILAVIRLGWLISVPGVNGELLREFLSQNLGGWRGWFLTAVSLGNFRSFSVFYLGIGPYVTAFLLLSTGSIILKILGRVVPFLKRDLKVTEIPRKYANFLAVAIALFQSYGVAVALERGESIVINPGLQFEFVTTVTLTAGSCLMISAGHAITKRGIGNGMVTIMVAGTALYCWWVRELIIS